MRNLLIIVTLFLLTFAVYGVELELGYVCGAHLTQGNVNDSHTVGTLHLPYKFGIEYFRNSHSKNSLGISRDFKVYKYLDIKLAFVSGYTKKHIRDSFWIDNKYVFVAAPIINFPINDRFTIKGIILGDAINAGFTYTFK